MNSAPHMTRLYKIHTQIKETYVGTTCYIQKMRTVLKSNSGISGKNKNV